MITLAQAIKERKSPQIKVISKKDCISLIASMVKLFDDPLKNWKVIAYKLRGLSPKDATLIYLSTKKGTRTNSADKKGQFLYITSAIVYPKKPKQGKLFK